MPFCEYILHCHLSRTPTCMHDPQVRVSRRPAYSGPRLRSSPHSPLRRRSQMHGSTAVATLPFFAFVQQGRVPFARHGHEAHMRANLIPADCPAEACAAIYSSAAPQCPERRLSLRRSCMLTSLRPGRIAFAGQAHAQGRVTLQKHVSLRRTGLPRRGFPAVGRTARAPTHR